MSPVDGDDAVLIAVAPDDRHVSRLDDEEVIGQIAFAEQDVTWRDRLDRTQLAQPGALLVIEARKRAVTVWRLLDAHPQRLVHDPSARRKATSST